jgi:hypothetical protein
MKIRTIIGVLLVFALVLGSTGVAVADEDGDYEPDQIRLNEDADPNDNSQVTSPGDNICNDLTS